MKDAPVCILEAVDKVAEELNTHLRWLSDRIKACEEKCDLPTPRNPTARPHAITTRSAGWGNGNWPKG